jgi:c-di-GMP-binding flagellar brake protein YcgR
MQERKHARFAVQRPVSFRGDFVAGTGTILNISRQGCAIVSDTIADAQAYLQLQVQLLEEEEPVQVDLAAVRWSGATRFGVEFIKMQQDVGEKLKQFVKLLELED